MGNVIGTKETLITTNEGLKLIRRERTVNGEGDHPGTGENAYSRLRTTHLNKHSVAMAMKDGYPFIFQMNDKAGHDELLEYTLQYRFTSERSHHTYIVRVERYIKHSYCIKFFDKANMLSDNKFSYGEGDHPGTGENAYSRLRTTHLNKHSVAMAMKDVYHRFVSSVVGETVFEHHRNNELSLYILVNKQYVEDIPQFTQKITDYVTEAMTNH